MATPEQTNYFLNTCFELENDYLLHLCEADELIREVEANALRTIGVSTANVPCTGNFAASSRRGQLYLPKIRLPKFSGRNEDWINFAHQFKSTIHDDRTINDQIRFHYLKACLDSKTASAIQHLTDYVTTWKYLEQLHLTEHDQKIRSEGNI